MENLEALQEKYKAQLLEIYRKSKNMNPNNNLQDIYQSQNKNEATTTQAVNQTINQNSPEQDNQPALDNTSLNDTNTNSNTLIDENQNANEQTPQNNNFSDMINAAEETYGGTGTLVVDVTTASNAIPIEGALIIVEKDLLDGNSVLVATTTTDENGKSVDKIVLPTKKKSLSLSPDNKQPYAVYRVIVKAKGFQSQNLDNVAIFDGIESIEKVSMKPL